MLYFIDIMYCFTVFIFILLYRFFSMEVIKHLGIRRKKISCKSKSFGWNVEGMTLMGMTVKTEGPVSGH